jgi:hypothetical protein
METTRPLVTLESIYKSRWLYKPEELTSTEKTLLLPGEIKSFETRPLSGKLLQCCQNNNPVTK